LDGLLDHGGGTRERESTRGGRAAEGGYEDLPTAVTDVVEEKLQLRAEIQNQTLNQQPARVGEKACQKLSR